MEDRQKQQIVLLRQEGLGYKKIATILDVSVDAVKSYCKRNKITTVEVIKNEPTIAHDEQDNSCPECGKEVIQIPKMRARRFCSNTCRDAWWKKHRSEGNRYKGKKVICPNCEKTFLVNRESERKYCCHACYIESRFGGGGHHE
ncbi:sigma factor-like helix-turn-helix DNA-binding protein [Enterococcus faecium]|uniref:sigma factor-like helix-turn-helix DNA-binding protein n=1 Tax=Enterococcus faecium TaxID=1352 RepID=UPI00100E1488|nr:sigma factor-like helix-turn-helix DNA-binding protein [Enterococcus faecium]EGP5553226.1 RNA polymerase subunit sigma-70 [Enterococcus faecium]MDQ8279702.1 sigma factor-like helix-turn-helix DNA-binding protein [Enterococcus faecium]MDQ8420990.1 sigma factor-like helix-turn-helix DNA-binding protein [Enterococcus faecium]RXW69840.1 RNA polymerase subunit sigma-70 [Enterococcus faecium]